MRADFRFVFTDFRGAEAETHIYFEIAGGTTNLAGAANALASMITPLSTAFLVRADVTIQLLPTIQTQAALSSSVDRSLLYLCRDGLNIASFTLPSPKALPFESVGPYAQIRITQQSILSDPNLSALLTLLRRTVTQYNTPFPQTGLVVAGLMNNQV